MYSIAYADFICCRMFAAMLQNLSKTMFSSENLMHEGKLVYDDKNYIFILVEKYFCSEVILPKGMMFVMLVLPLG